MKAKRNSTSKRSNEPQVLYRAGRPTAVLIDIDEYRRLLELAENQYDLERLAELNKRPQHYRPFDEFLEEWEQENT